MIKTLYPLEILFGVKETLQKKTENNYLGSKKHFKRKQKIFFITEVIKTEILIII